MRNFIREHKRKIVIISVLVVICAFICFYLFYSPIRGYLTGYQKADENNGHTVYYTPEQFMETGIFNFNMTRETGRDIIEHPENYTAYWIGLNIQNTSLITIYNLSARLCGNYNNLWFDKYSLCLWRLDLGSGEARECGILVVVKDANMTDEDVDRIIRSISINISALYSVYLPFASSAVIRFEGGNSTP